MERNGNILKWDIEGIELPPNITPPEGEGFVTFSVDLKSGLPSGTKIENAATIVFDMNPPIRTNTWTNIIDMEPPKTVMKPIKYTNGDTIVSVSCTSTDNTNGAGPAKYLFFASVNNSPFTMVGESFQNSMDYKVSATEKNNYRFYALAIDNVDNAEQKIPAIAEVKSIPVSNKQVVDLAESIDLYPNPASGMVTIDFYTESNTRLNLLIYSLTGELLINEYSGWVQNGRHQLNFDLSGLKPGVYFVKAMYDNKFKTFKLIRE
jgi:hypothetical protein